MLECQTKNDGDLEYPECGIDENEQFFDDCRISAEHLVSNSLPVVIW